MRFKNFYALMAILAISVMTGCRSKMDLDNIDAKAEVQMGVALPVGSMHATIGDFFGAGIGDFYVDTIPESEGGHKDVITWKDTFKIARDFHPVDLAQYISEKELNLNVYEKIPAAIMIGTNKQVTGTGMPVTLDFDMPLKLKGINHKDSLDKERLDSALIEMASFSSLIKQHNLPLEWDWIDRVTLDLGEQIHRPAGRTMVVYDKTRDNAGYNQTIPTQVDDFTINLMGKNSAGQYTPGLVIDSCNFVIHFTFTIPAGTTVSIPEDAGFDYKLGVQFIDYAAIWGKFKQSSQMHDENVIDLSESWRALDFISRSNLPFADPKIDMHIMTQVAGALYVDGDYLFAEDAYGQKHYATFQFGSETKQTFHRQFYSSEYLDPITSAIGDSTTNMTILFDKDPERGHIDQLFRNMPQKLGYKFNLDFLYQLPNGTPQIRITPNTSIRIDAICTLPMIFNEGVHIEYKDTMPLDISQFSIDSLLAGVEVIDTLKTTKVQILLHAKNEIPLDIKATMLCLDENGNVVMDPTNPTKPFTLFQQDTIMLKAPQYEKKGGSWQATKPGETTIAAHLTIAEANLFPKIKKLVYSAAIDDDSLAEAYKQGLSNVRITEDQGLTLKIGISGEVDAILNFGKDDNK